EHGFAAGNVRLFCPTRWTVRGDLIDSMLENYTALMQLLDECLESRHYYTGARWDCYGYPCVWSTRSYLS
uniref:Uncharacterized protein n=1 Tax=Amphimedon queenslandica TaxID=400682 RepID=A0A1X7UQ39_AMPQE